ncbi:MAG: hypothetical protein NC337_02010, partial [Roseburia sp.]|nr:hypothetical protein [Roseburia sp.]
MVVQHNLTALNANRMLGITQGTLSKSTEKLSSGYKVNRAADDAAGLSISEKMRKQIRGLTQASANAEDGISAVQTAEGALTEVHDMLQRMNELATKAANGTNSEDDRQYIQDEISQLTTEIDRVAETTKFNEIYLLKGDGTKGTKTVNAHDAGLKGTLESVSKGKSKFTAEALKAGDTVKIGGTDYTIVGSERPNDYADMKTTAAAKGDVITQDGVTYTVSVAAAAGDLSSKSIDVVDSDGNNLKLAVKEGATLTDKNSVNGTTVTLVGNNTITMGATTDAGTPAWAAGDKIVDKDGVEYTYVDTAKNAFLNDVKHTTAGFYKSVGNTASDAAYTPVAGDIYTIAATGEKGAMSNKGIQTVSDIQTAIKGLGDGDTVKFYDSANAKAESFIVGITTKEDGSKMTADDIAARVKEGKYVDVNGSYYYAVPSASDEKTDISLKQAYEMMAKELEAASSIGTDTAASVKNNGDGTFEITQGKVEIDNSLTFALHVGADADMTNKIGVNIQTMSSANLGVKNLNV